MTPMIPSWSSNLTLAGGGNCCISTFFNFRRERALLHLPLYNPLVNAH